MSDGNGEQAVTDVDVEIAPEIDAEFDAEIDESAGSYTSESSASAISKASRAAKTGAAGATGRRKQAIARVRILPGSGKWTINGRTLEEYFPNKVHQQVVLDAFRAIDAECTYDVIANVHGGGITGQAGAIRLGIARSLNEIDEEILRPVLKKAGYLTRDPRAKERKKYGLKKARKAPQYSKR